MYFWLALIDCRRWHDGTHADLPESGTPDRTLQSSLEAPSFLPRRGEGQVRTGRDKSGQSARDFDEANHNEERNAIRSAFSCAVKPILKRWS